MRAPNVLRSLEAYINIQISVLGFGGLGGLGCFGAALAPRTPRTPRTPPGYANAFGVGRHGLMPLALDAHRPRQRFSIGGGRVFTLRVCCLTPWVFEVTPCEYQVTLRVCRRVVSRARHDVLYAVVAAAEGEAAPTQQLAVGLRDVGLGRHHEKLYW